MMKRDLDTAAPAAPEELPAVSPHRRGFFGAAMGAGFALLGVCGAIWTAVVGRFLLPNVTAGGAHTFKAGFASEYPPGSVDGRFQQEHGVWIVHAGYRGRHEIAALRTTCTHLGCIVAWQPGQGKFKCPCHGSGFRPNGVNVEGPAPRPLERCAIRRANDGQLEVDTSRTFQEELGQWNDPTCYVVG